MALIRTIIAYLLAVAGTFIGASTFHTHQILSGLRKLGVEISLGQQATATLDDLVGFTVRSDVGVSFPIIIAAGMLVAFLVAEILKKLLRPLAPYAYMIAGAAAMASIILLMVTAFQITPIAGARGTMGLVLQGFAGLIGGTIFTILKPGDYKNS